MTGVLAQYLSLETAGLALFEFVLCLVAALATFVPPGPAATLDPIDLDLGVCLASLTVVSALAAGLYRPEICFDRRGSAARFGISEIAVFGVALLLFHTVRSGLGLQGLLRPALVLAVWAGLALLSRAAFIALLRGKPLARPVVVLGNGPRAARITELLRARYSGRFEPLSIATAERFPPPEVLRRQRAWGIVIAAEDMDQEAADALLDSKLRGVRVLRDTGFAERQLGRIDLDTIDADWLLAAEGFTVGPAAAMVRRMADIMVSLALLFLTLPLVLLVAVLIKLDSPGPILYRQQRAGYLGNPFTLLKFRSMTVDAEAAGAPRWAQVGDPRVTRIGGFIRSMRIDELPQLLNVLRGEMSMIGPRPERPHFVEQLTRIIPFYRGRAYVKPGLTGWAQVNFPYGASVEDAREKLAYDLYYVKNRSLLLDLLILFSTVRVILFREGAR